MTTNPKIERYFSGAKKWPEELAKLRKILRSCELTEELKWGKPCYAWEGSNVVLIVPFKDTCALLFTKGALLKDPKGLLIKPGENTQSARQMRFTSAKEITKLESVVKAYVQEAVEVEKAGLEVTLIKSTELKFPAEFQNKLDRIPALKAAFTALTPGRQRAYYIYFSAPKQSKTREARVEKCMRSILEGKGLND